MRWSAKQLRWLALGGALLLAAVLAAFLGLAKYRAGVVWQRILKRNGVNLVQESNGVTYSQSLRGRTVFTLHAERSTPRGNGIYSLHNAVLILYGKNGRDDRIHGNEFEYDQGQGTLRAIGEVHMDLQAPEPAGGPKQAKDHPPTTSFSFLPDDEAAADPAVIHVRTSGLVYLRKLDVAATKEPVEFSYQGLRCESLGAEFDSGENTLRLLAEVRLAGSLRDAPFTLAAARADLDQNAETIALVAPIWASDDRAGSRTARADHALLFLRKDGSLQTAEGQGNVVLREGTRTLSAPQMHTQFAAGNRPERTVFTGGVLFGDLAQAQTTHASSANLTLETDAGGALHSALAEGGVRMRVETLADKATTATRELQAQRVEAGFVAGTKSKGALLKSLHLTGAAQLAAESVGGAAAGVKPSNGTRTTVHGDELTGTFTAGAGGQPQPERLLGTGHTVLTQSGPDGARQESEGDSLEAQFVEAQASGRAGQGTAPLEVSTAVQTGHVVLHAWPAQRPATKNPAARGDGVRASAPSAPSIGHAQRAVFQGSAGTLTLTAGGGARADVVDGSTELRAPEIVLHQGTGDGEASGGVAATDVAEGGSPATHVLAARAKLLHSLNIAEFFGSDREPAQMWQGTSQVSAAQLVLDARRHTLAARPGVSGGLVHGVFASQHAGEEKTPANASVTGKREGAEAAKGSLGASEASDLRSVTHPENEAKVVSVQTNGATSGLNAAPQLASQLADRRQTEASGDAVRVAAEALDYSDPDHEATFRGHVVLRDAEGTLSGDHGVAFLQATGGGPKKPAAAAPTAGQGSNALLGATPGMGGRLERFVLLGEVHLLQPGRSGQGQQLTYTAATDRFVLTGAPGAPPRILDAQRGTITGETLVFGSGSGSAADRSVVVTGAPGGDTQAAGKPFLPRRVHTETDIKR